ncbi:MAG TPA: S-methyl-5'-thioadenosine phosphorylase [Mycobacteriales bacterium]|jgi:5'-methylthioadenosine phosphorylase|nr:S-methyl-5'-thioadenosine phosphorylase [Mycobacteriales bacterium]
MVQLPPVADARAEVGVFGGSGFYSLLDEADEVAVDTPYGPPSAPVVVGAIEGRRVAFLPRHGRDHRFPPHRIPYRANLWAMRSLGVTQVVAPCAAGSLRSDVHPGDFVVCDQLVDRTSGRAQTFYDDRAVHVSFADPYCPDGRAAALAAARAQGIRVHDGGTMVVVEGPRFSTRAESRWYAAAGWSVVNMTGHPEAVLARELELCYTSIALITDYDVGVPGVPAVTADEVFRVFGDNNARLRTLLHALLPALPETRACPCPNALAGADFTG